MKYLLVLLVVVVAAWLLLGRRGRPEPPSARPRANDSAVPSPMVACQHCGVHLPRSDAVVDGAGRVFCSDEHRVAGPR